MIIERTFDYAMLRRIVVADPRLYEAMTDDWSPSIEEYGGPPQSHEITYLTIPDAAGFFMFVPRTHTCWELHTVMHLWGSAAIATMKAAFEWIWENTDCQRIVTCVPAYNRLAVRFGKQAGLKVFGVNEKSYQKGGVLHDEIWMGISQGEITCRCLPPPE